MQLNQCVQRKFKVHYRAFARALHPWLAERAKLGRREKRSKVQGRMREPGAGKKFTYCP